MQAVQAESSVHRSAYGRERVLGMFYQRSSFKPHAQRSAMPTTRSVFCRVLQMERPASELKRFTVNKPRVLWPSCRSQLILGQYPGIDIVSGKAQRHLLATFYNTKRLAQFCGLVPGL